MNRDGIVIVGSGIAGYALIREFRRLDTHTPLTLVTADNGDLYSKPMLSNALALGRVPEDLVQKDAITLAAEFGFNLRAHTRITGIDRAVRTIALDASGKSETLGYDRLVLAVGARPRSYRVPGSGQVSVTSVNNLADYRRWRADLDPNDTVLLIGAGLIGVEFANDLASVGHRVALVDPAPQPLGRLLPEALGAVVADALAEAGVELIRGQAVADLAADGNRAAARLTDGRKIAFDKALAAIGLVANTDLAIAAGLAVEQGIRVDQYLRTSDPAICALGDCAQTDAGLLPFVLPLLAEARALAKTLAGIPTPLRLTALPVVVKTPALPIVACPPAPGAAGTWDVAGKGRDRRALFASPGGLPLGFALTGAATRDRQALAAAMPDLLAA